MNVLDDIPFRLDEAAFLRLTHLQSLAEVQGLLDRVLAAARPKAAYKVCYIGERGADTVRDRRPGVRQRGAGPKPGRTWSASSPTWPPAGPSWSRCRRHLADLFAGYCLDVLKELVLGAARDHLLEHLRTAYGASRLSSMNPGSGDARLWPLAQQRPLFGLLGDVEQAIGVRLTPSLLMQPNKSVSGIFFPSEVHFESCQLCTREGCPRRRAPYSGEPPPTRRPA